MGSWRRDGFSSWSLRARSVPIGNSVVMHLQTSSFRGSYAVPNPVSVGVRAPYAIPSNMGRCTPFPLMLPPTHQLHHHISSPSLRKQQNWDPRLITSCAFSIPFPASLTVHGTASNSASRCAVAEAQKWLRLTNHFPPSLAIMPSSS